MCFIKDWSHISKLISARRYHQLERLQKIIEMEEFVSFMNSDGELNHLFYFSCLVLQWIQQSSTKVLACKKAFQILIDIIQTCQKISLLIQDVNQILVC